MKVVRNLQFFVKGYFKYTKSDEPLAPIEGSLQNANYVITGANSGIGFQAATFAASKKAKVYMICRNKQKGEKAVREISQKTNNKDVYLIIGQLGEKRNLAQIVRQIKERVGRIDVLVHNAGCMNHQYHENADAVQTNYATNVLSVYYLTKQLLPCLHSKSKIIVVSSGGMYNAPLVTDDIYMRKDFDGTTQYARNKRMQVCMFEQFSKTIKDKGVFVSLHPGWVDTPGVKTQMPNFYKMLHNKLKTPQEGADTINYLAMTPFQNLKAGQFYYNRQIANKHLAVSGTHYTQEQANQLMFKLHQLTGV